MDKLVYLLVLAIACEHSVATEHCTSRAFQGYNGTVRTRMDNTCPYEIYADSWMPGQENTLEIASVEETPFQLFLVSIQLGPSLIGEMRPLDDTSMVTCGRTSVQHTDLSDKPTVTFTWTPPSDIQAEEVMIRASVGTEETFWIDCDIFLWDRVVLEETTTTTEPADMTTATDAETTTLRVAGPDVANEDTTTRQITSTHTLNGLKHQTISADSCAEAGNMYTVLAGSECRQFSQKVSTPFQAAYNHTCPGGTRFDVHMCACSFMSIDNCPN